MFKFDAIKSVAFIAVATLIWNPAMAQQGPISQLYQETVYFNSFDSVTNTYTGQVRLSSNPCVNVHYDVALPFSGVKNADEAKDKVKSQADKIIDDINHSASHCNMH